MSPGDQEPKPPENLPTEVADALARLDEHELRATIDFAQKRRRHLRRDATDLIEAGPGEEIVRVEEQGGYTLVSKRQPCGNDCADCPHGPYLYHVREVTRPEGGTKLHWTYLGLDET